MNKIYKVIWSKVRNCYIVVSELAKSHDSAHGTRSRSGCARKAAVLAAFVLTTSLLVAPDWVQAATATNSGNPSANQAVNIENKNNTTAQGSDAYATYDSQGNLIMGKDNQVSPIQKDPKTGNARVDKQAENVACGNRPDWFLRPSYKHPVFPDLSSCCVFQVNQAVSESVQVLLCCI